MDPGGVVIQTGGISGYSREEFLEGLVDHAESDIR